VVAVNKMDLVDFNRERYEEICADFRTFGDPLGFREIRFFPVSALDGDNVVATSERTPWYTEGSMLEYLETVEVREQPHALPFRFPVQYVIRPHLDYRGFAGQVSSGIVRPGDDILVLPSMKRSKVRSIDTYDGEMAEAYFPTGVVIRLEDEIDISRGDMLVHADAAPSVERHFEAMVVWMADQPLDVRKSYLIKHCSRYVRTDVRKVDFKVNLDTMAQEKAVNLQLNDIGLVKFTAHRPIFADPYAENRQTGAFVIIDTMTNNTVGAGMILRTTSAPDDGQDIRSTVGPHDRASLAGALSMTAWIQGGPADTLAAVAYRVEQRLFEQGILATVVEAKDENIARDGALALDQLVEVSARLNDAGVIVLAAVAESSRHDRNEARLRVGDSRWREITIGGDSEVDDAVEEVLNHLRQTGRVQ
jgi:sulfate adenylyltransferase subunit 1 (EFTu-like GTPase family)